MGKAIEYNERVQHSGREQGDRRWKEMGIVRQTMHKTGARLDPAISASESTEGKAVAELKKLDVQRAQLARFVPAAEKAELAKRQERAGVPREVLGEQRRQEAAREQRLKRSRGSAGRVVDGAELHRELVASIERMTRGRPPAPSGPG